MPTQLQAARNAAAPTETMRRVAEDESVPVERIREEVARGRAVIPCNPLHNPASPSVVGRAFRVKVNANIGRSAIRSSQDEEREKLAAALCAGADFVMDLSVGADIGEVRRDILAHTPVPLGTVPIYEAFQRADKTLDRLDASLLLSVIEDQARDGVDFMTLHAGLLREHLPLAARRTMGIASRGGAILAAWMSDRGAENPLYTAWDDVLAICAEYDVTVSLGDGLRPGCLADASDEAQFAELDRLGELVIRCREHGVQVMVEGPGHVPFDQIRMNMEREQRVCDDAPFYVLGPVITDVAPGYDHITAAIGGTEAAVHGAALLCYVTPAEHLGLPTLQEVTAGVVASRIAAHAADVAKGIPGAREWDDRMAKARFALDWDRQFEIAMDGKGAHARYESTRSEDEDGQRDFCSMCGKDFCAVKASRRLAGEAP